MRKRKGFPRLGLFVRFSVLTTALLVNGVAAWAAEGRAGETPAPQNGAISLAGVWSFRLDPQNAGEQQNWATAELPDSIQLPGSTAQAGYGDDVSADTKWTGDIVDKSWFTDARYEKYRKPGNVKVPFWLQPAKHYVGAAWYQRKVAIPPGWAGRRIVLSLERCHWETQVWVDGKKVGVSSRLSVPHECDLTKLLSPGEHVLAIRVDNTVKIKVGMNAHSVSDHTQTNWNGIIGRIELRVEEPVYVDDVQVYPDVARRMARLDVTVGNITGKTVTGVILVEAIPRFKTGEPVPRKLWAVPAEPGRSTISIDYPMGETVKLWDEFTPNVYTLAVTIQAGQSQSTRSVDFGMRQMGVEGTQFTINGRKTFIRGTLECCIFPLTGYPPTDVESWTRILKVAKAHGLNQLRFHSWCPPEAAFIAGDRLGFMHQVECCAWTTVGEDLATDDFLRAEAERILKAYGNHPSFCFLAHGNEPSGQNQKRFLGDLVASWKKKDPRRLYTSSAGWPLIPETDYHSTPEPRVFRWGEGLKCRLNARPPETRTDYRDFIARHADKPVVSHEIGQWCVYPDFSEIDKYTSVLKARNFEVFRDSMRENHMLDQAHDFLIASGKLQTLCYKEDIESALRTPGFGGFQLLDLHDFPGQGTALVGVLNPFWGSKGYVTPEEYHRFCCETVPLARMARRIWTADETFQAGLEIAHFGPAPIEGAVVAWKLADEAGRAVADGELPARTIPLGNGTSLGEVQTTLSPVKTAKKLKLVVGVEGTPYANDWDIWVYPPKVDTTAPASVVVAEDLDEKTVSVLRQGGKVLLLPGPGRVIGDARGRVPPGFTSIFWNTAWTRGQAPHTLGILCDPKHPALRQFPTEPWSNWHWWDLVHDSQIMILNDLPAGLRPVVQVIDDWVTNRRLGLAFEARVAGGSLLVCGMDLASDLPQRPVARQMRHSLLAYMVSEQFSPRQAVDLEQIRRLISGKPSPVIKVDSEASGHEGANAADGNPLTIWHTPWGEGAPGYPHEIQLKLEKESLIRGLAYLPRQDMQNGWISQYEVYVSSDPGRWGRPVAAGSFERTKAEKEIRFATPVKGRYVRFVAKAGIDDQPYASIAELRVLAEPGEPAPARK